MAEVKRRKDIKDVTEKDIAFTINYDMFENDVDYMESINVNLNRGKRELINKMVTPLWQLEELFLREQESKGNSKATVDFYKRSFKRMYEYIGFHIPVTCEDHKKALEKYGLDGLGKVMPIATLEMNDFEYNYRKYLEEVLDIDNESTIAAYFRGMRVIMYYAMENGWMTQRKIKIKSPPSNIKNCYTNAELDKLLKKPNIDKFAEYRNWVIINYLLGTGNRLSSIIGLKIEDVDFEEMMININRQKNKHPIRIPLVKKLAPVLSEFIYNYREIDRGLPVSPSESLFCGRHGDPLTEGGLQKAIADYNKSRGVFKTSIHLFRHTFAKNWIIAGGDILTLQKMLGQKSLKVIQEYANLYSSDIKPKADEFAILNHKKRNTGKTIQRRK